MSRDRTLLGVAAALAVTAATVGAAVAARTASPSDAIPGERAQAAMSALAEPSAPQPLPGSTAGAAGAHRFAAGCDALRAAYQAPDAPVPAGSVVTVAADGGLRFDDPFGPAALFVRDEVDGSCTYEIASATTITVSSPDLPAIDQFATVSCFRPLSLTFLAVAELVIDGQPNTLIISQSADLGSAEPQPYMLALAPVPAAVALGGGPPDGAVSIDGLTGTEDDDGRGGTVTGSGPTGPVTADFTCTVSNLQGPGF